MERNNQRPDSSLSPVWGGLALALALAMALTAPDHWRAWIPALLVIAVWAVARTLLRRHGTSSDTTTETEPRADTTAATTPETTSAHRRPRVLLVDDNAVSRLVASHMLSAEGVEVIEADDGEGALTRVRERPFDLILMDYRMPGLDGCETTRRLRRLEESLNRPRTPVVALSGEESGDLDTCLGDDGFDDRLAKPCSRTKLQALLRRWLGDVAQADVTAPVVTEDDELENERLLALQAVETGDGQTLLDRTLALYREETPRQLSALHHAVVENDASRARRLAHDLKSSSALLGLRRLAGTFGEIEAAARDGRLDGLADRLSALRDRLPKALDNIQKAAAELGATVPYPIEKAGPGHILLVDDDAAFRLVTTTYLEKAGFMVTQATSSAEALALIAEHPPELILLDALMEGMDGFELCQRLQADPLTHPIPVLMVTGLEDIASVHRAFEAGAAGFITKPVNYPILIHRIRFQLRVAREALELQESREQLTMAQQLARLGHWRWQPRAGLFCISDALARLCGIADADAYDTLEAFLALVHPEDRDRVRRNLRNALETQRLEPLDYRLLPPSGGEMRVHQELALLNPGTLLGTVQDITRQYESEQKIRKLAYSDELTGLASRTYFMRHLEDTIRMAERHHEKFALLYLDLDSFKDVNDTLGHDIGDQLLQVVAQRLLRALRKTDFAARLGGDEFCILLDDLSYNYAAEVASRCLQEVNRALTLGGRVLHPRISVGIANYPRDGRDAHSLLKAADSAMYAAKQAGKHRYAFYRPELTRRARERLDMEQALRRALEKGELLLHYQPQIAMADGRVTGLEALVRWRHPERGLVPPNEFIPVAERIGLIRQLGRQVLREACEQARRWLDLGLPAIQLAVNISPLHFRDPAIVTETRAVLEETGFDPAHLELEVTENVVQVGDNLDYFHRIKELGVRIAIDDFGTGYSSLASLKKLPIDALKVDQLFVRDMVEDPASATLVGTIVGMAKALGLEVVAEGVESEQELQILAALGCDLLQGYHFSRPVSADEVPALLRQHFVTHPPQSLTNRAGGPLS